MKEFNFKVDRKISTMQIGKNKYKFAIDRSGATDINITQDKIEDVIYSIFDSSEFLDLVRIITNIKGKQKIPKIYLQGVQGAGNGLVDSTGCGFVDTTEMVLSDVDISVTKKRMILS